MTYVPNVTHDFFISYVHTNAQKHFQNPRRGGWAQHFAEDLAATIDDRLDVRGDDGVKHWNDWFLKGNKRIDDEIKELVESCAVFIPLLSSQYFKSAWCLKEANWFASHITGADLEFERVFVVRQDPISKCKPPKGSPDFLSEEKGYEFFERGRGNKISPLGWPLPNVSASEHVSYFDCINALADEVADVLRELRRLIEKEAAGGAANTTNQENTQSLFGTNAASPIPDAASGPNVAQGANSKETDGSIFFLATATESVEGECELIREALTERKHFVLPKQKYPSFSEIQENLDKYLPKCDAFVQIVGSTRGSWNVDDQGFVRYEAAAARNAGLPICQWWRGGELLDGASDKHGYAEFVRSLEDTKHNSLDDFVDYVERQSRLRDSHPMIYVDTFPEVGENAHNLVDKTVRDSGFSAVFRMSRGRQVDMTRHREEHLRISSAVIFMRREIDFTNLRKQFSQLNDLIPSTSAVAAIYTDDFVDPDRIYDSDTIEEHGVYKIDSTSVPTGFLDWVRSIRPLASPQEKLE